VLSTLKNDQLGEGLDSFGRLVGEYAASTQEVYAKRSPKPRRAKDYGASYNFEWTGKFMDSMKIKKEGNDGYVIDSARKAELESIYDTKLTALTEENNDFVNNKVVNPALYDSIFKSLLP